MAVEARRDTAWDIGVFQAICFDHGAEAGFDLSDHDLRDAYRDDSSWLEELDALGVFVSGEWPVRVSSRALSLSIHERVRSLKKLTFATPKELI
jgi:hypothetical protein